MVNAASIVLMGVSLIMNIYVLCTCFVFRLKMKYMVLIYLLIAVLANPIRIFIDNLSLPYFTLLAPYTFIHLVPVMIWAEGTFLGKMFAYYTGLSISFFLTWLGSLLAQLIFPYESDAYKVLWALISVLFYIGYSIFIWKFGKKLCGSLLQYINTPVWWLFTILPFASFLVMKNLFFDMQTVIPLFIRYEAEVLLLPFFIIIGLIMLTSSIVVAQARIQTESDLKLAQSVISSGHDYYEKLAALSENLRVLRHDSKHHLSTIQRLLEAGDEENAKSYLMTLKAHNEEIPIPDYCESRVMNAFLDSFSERCKEAEINFGCKISMEPRLAVDEYELCIILGNLLENAFTACLRTPKPREAFIHLIIKPHGEQFGISVKNSFDGKIMQNSEGLVSQKQDGGIGINSIKAIIRKYNGEYIPQWDGEVFSAYVIMRI